MGLLEKLLGKEEKQTIPLIEFVKSLVFWASDLRSIGKHVASTTFPEDVKKSLRNEIIYLQIFAIEMVVDFRFEQKEKNAIMENFYKLLFAVFDEMQAHTNAEHSLREIVEDGLDRTITEYWLALADDECQDDPPICVGRTFSSFCEYPNDYDITTLGADLFDASTKTLLNLINKYRVEI